MLNDRLAGTSSNFDLQSSAGSPKFRPRAAIGVLPLTSFKSFFKKGVLFLGYTTGQPNSKWRTFFKGNYFWKVQSAYIKLIFITYLLPYSLSGSVTTVEDPAQSAVAVQTAVTSPAATSVTPASQSHTPAVTSSSQGPTMPVVVPP